MYSLISSPNIEFFKGLKPILKAIFLYFNIWKNVFHNKKLLGLTFLQNNDSLNVKFYIFLLIHIYSDISCRRKFSCSYHFEKDISHIKKKVRGERLSYIKVLEKRKNLFYLVHQYKSNN